MHFYNITYIMILIFQHCLFTHQVQEFEGDYDETSVECVFWDVNASNGLGDWSDDGCQLNTTSNGRVVCLCDHLTSFAVLVVRKCLICLRGHNWVLLAKAYSVLLL